MEKTKTRMRWMLYAMAGTVIGCTVLSCIKNADSDEQPQPPESDTTFVVTDSTTLLIDSAFRATGEYLAGEWMAQYTGYDPLQKKTSAIRRLVFFAPDGTYDSHVQGIVDVEDTITTYKEFEHEHGTYSLDEQMQLMKYSIEYDSLLNFMTDQLEFYPGKMRPGMGIQTEYSERLWFSHEEEGRRDWIRTDKDLTVSDSLPANIIYIMKRGQ